MYRGMSTSVHSDLSIKKASALSTDDIQAGESVSLTCSKSNEEESEISHCHWAPAVLPSVCFVMATYQLSNIIGIPIPPAYSGRGIGRLFCQCGIHYGKNF